jgi:Polyketide cyclase / dehydrase and lipid transport
MRRGLAEVGSLRPDAVWERYASPSRWSSWSPQIGWVECQPDRLQPGLTGTVHGLFGVRAHFEVLSVDEVRRTWSWRARTGPVALLLHHAVLDGPGGGSQATLEVDGPALAVLAYAPLADVALRRLVRP